MIKEAGFKPDWHHWFGSDLEACFYDKIVFAVK